MGHSDYSVASAHALRGSQLLGEREAHELHRQQQKQSMDQLKDESRSRRQSRERKSVRFTPSTNFNNESEPDVSTDTDIFTQSPHASRGSVSSIDFAESLPQVRVAREASVQLLKPVVYSPPQDSANLLLPATTYSPSSVSVKKRVEEYEALPDHISSTQVDLRIDTDDLSHKRSPSGSSTSSGSGRSRQKDDIYFTPVDVTRSQIFLSSPVSSPSASPDSPTLPRETDDDDECPTPRASRALSRRPSQVYVGGVEKLNIKDDALKITPVQLDQLVVALAKSRMLVKHVSGDWWDLDDVPDDESVVSSFSQVSLPTLTSASTLYTRQNENFVNDQRNTNSSQSQGQMPRVAAQNGAFGGVALCDTKVHGTPVRFVSKNYRHGSSILDVGTCTYLSVTYGTEVECALSIEAPSNGSSGTRIVLQCKTQVVDRKSGKQVYTLMAEEDVTKGFIKAALAELAEARGKAYDDIKIASPSQDSATESPDIDWVEFADELQAAADVSDLVDETAAIFKTLESETASMQTLTLMSSLDRIKENYEDFLILRPIAFHDNGLPSSMRLPWVSQRLYTDWYQSKKIGDDEVAPGDTQEAQDFQACIVANVAKQGAKAQAFDCEAYWGEHNKQYLHCVPLMENSEGHCDAWACFVRGEFIIDP
ncbi:uncharacterized protein MYCFIDRAFT_80375 [Pseudocercospora fijiensis CIRAD86]|uniref:Uncharacterized protein n=1 Tax=Pseudocercospora fijiensis (strain CIRAD86) TaxID=383855 RepID=M3B027_PSEFD|nr:uncharacterized protein MYCFIDRAFT_80375 [Pseudocercospora fijiensis CIRAD86]EME82767.1 hypothetical protein MYCFIDRAFT_80375 [Pseudocercospora fijiensis CIRAD86]